MTQSHEDEIARFPSALRMLLETELAAGNSIIEIGHSYPASPRGAYVKLANKVSTHARATCETLVFFERNSSIYSGEFTDANRFFFVLEPPNSPPPEQDMDAIRKSYQPQFSLPSHDLRSESFHGLDKGLERTSNASQDNVSNPKLEVTNKSDSVQALLVEESAVGETHVFYFRDARPPQEVKFILERELSSLFRSTLEHGKMCMRANANLVGADYKLLLSFDTATQNFNYYTLRIEISWREELSSSADYFRKTSRSWIALWTREFIGSNPPVYIEGLEQRYLELCEADLKADQLLTSTECVMKEILSAVKGGGAFRTAHKEGGTNIYWTKGRFVRSDYGDYPAMQYFANDDEFLRMLRQFYHSEVTRNAANGQLSEFDTWQLILRRMEERPSSSP